ncbi:cytochrome P450 [Polychaeton citri CBS 116435]|uniref:Cytochrome P450 n=1 Tax=Polychaeton citri CBS 116435 TaxID=1314669 RepID=A0A9P4UIP0_9PEZI|nr:cytochrome P450 [Polychaeton citri CBS 116435]
MDWFQSTSHEANFSLATRVALWILSLGILIYFIDTIYSVYFGLLSSFPGPKMCAFSRLPYLIVTSSGKRVPWLTYLHNKYGGVVRIAPDVLTFTDERAWDDICGSTRHAKEGMNKAQTLPNRADSKLMESCAASLDLFNSETYRPWIHSFDRFSRPVAIPAVLKRFPMLHQPLLFALKHWGGKEQDAFLEPIMDRFDRRVTLLIPRNDLLQLILDGDGPKGEPNKNTMPMDLLRDFAPFMILGACDPMPVVMTAFNYFVFCEEGAAIPSGTDREVPKSGAQIARSYVPGGITVVMLHGSTYQLDEHFTRPKEFISERWLLKEAGRPAEFDGDPRSVVHPFSVGPQQCLGQDVYGWMGHLLLTYTIQIELLRATTGNMQASVSLECALGSWHGELA